MCLYADKKVLKEWKAKQKALGVTRVKFWKAVRPRPEYERIEAEWQCHYYYKPGVNRAATDIDARKIFDKQEIRRGVIHLYLTRHAAKYNSATTMSLMPVWVSVRDVVVMGRTSLAGDYGTMTAGARKVTVERKTFDRLTKEVPQAPQSAFRRTR